MRLTLRTLLAYLDDTLEPAEAKLMGDKVAESDIAPDLIERIKRVTRRRGLAAPPVTGDEDGTSDPNTVAEYLDNALPGEQITEVEEAALTSDSHLAEISACHQILTLVLGEPAKVPPTARQRMYRVVKGPEAIPYRKPAPATSVAGVSDPDHAYEENHEADEALLLGMKSTRMLIPVAAAAAILLLLVGVIMFAIPSPPPKASQGYVALSGRIDNEPRIDPSKLAEQKRKQTYDQHLAKGRTAQTAKNWDTALEAFKAAQATYPGDVVSAQLIRDVEKARADAAQGGERSKLFAAAIEQRARTAIKGNDFLDAATAIADATRIDADHPDVRTVLQELATAREAFTVRKKPVEFEEGPMPREAGKQLIITPKNVPDGDRRVIGRLASRDAMVLNRQRGAESWDRVEALKDLSTTDTVMALPGQHGEVKLDNGIVLMLWGGLPQFQTIPVLDLQESRIILHNPPMGFDADITLESGRVFITRPAAKDKAAETTRIRVRFKEEIWQITLLSADAEVCVDLLGAFTEGTPFAKDKNGLPPKAEFYFALLKGNAGLKVNFKEYPMLQAPMRADWESVGGEFNAPEKINAADMEWWNRNIPMHEGAKAMQEAIDYFRDYVKKSQSTTEIVFNSAMKDEKEQPNRRAYAVHCLQAMDSIAFLADALEVAEGVDVVERAGFVVRGVGMRSVQHWCGQAADRDWQFYRLLIDKKNYTEEHAHMVMQLLHPFRQEDLQKREIAAALFDAMRHERLAIRELAYLHLAVADPTGAREVGFIDLSTPEQSRDPLVAKWKASYKKRVIDKKK